MAEDPAFPLDRAGAVERTAEILEDPPTRADAVATDSADSSEEIVLASGHAASPGQAVGALCTTIDGAIEGEAAGTPVVLVRRETSPADIAGMAAAVGLVTSLGGLVSHAAVVARSWGTPAVVGASDITLDDGGIRVGDRWIPDGETITVDGDRGVVLAGDARTATSVVEEAEILRAWQAELGETPGAAPAAESTAAQSTAAETIDGATPGEEATPETCERVLALKGMAKADAIAGVLRCPLDDVEAVVAELVESGRAQEMPSGHVRLVPEALAEANARFETHAVRTAPTIDPLLDDFHAANDALKTVISAWQLRDVDGESVPNDHSDPDYDAGVIGQLRNEVHRQILPIVSAAADVVPRLGSYTDRLAEALDAIESGDTEMVAHPMRDSYHTVWFELHEELIRLAGRNRADEAAAGRA